MSSWLGGIGSGLGQSLSQVGGSLSTFTGQISNFTKDILLEGAEEVGDATTELHVSNSRLMTLEGAYTSQKSEHDRLQKVHAELEEKLEAAEIQIKQQTMEHRRLLQQKEVEISHLKARQGVLQEEVQKLQHSSQPASEPAVLPLSSASSSSSYLPHSSGAHQGFQGDEMDFSDVIWSQQEINRLSNEVSRLEAEAAHWRRLSQASKASGAASSDQEEVVRLQRTIKELRSTVGRRSWPPCRLAALQDAQQQKLAEVTRRHREELAEYEERIEELEEQIHNGSSSSVSAQESSRIAELQGRIQAQQEEAELQDRKLRELTDSLAGLGREQAASLREKEEVQEENRELLQNYARLQSSVEELQTRVQEQEGKALHKAHQDNARPRQTLSENEPRAEVEHADILELNTIIETLRREKAELEQERLDLLERVSLQAVEDLRKQLEEREQALKEVQQDRDTLSTELEELDLQNQEATQHLISLKDQLSAQHKETDVNTAHLQHELDTARAQKGALQLELEAQREKLSKTAFALNDMHMGKQQLEDMVKELREKLGQAHERSAQAREETARLSGTLLEREEELAAVRVELSLAGATGGDGEDQQRALEEKAKELAELRQEVAALRNQLEKVKSEDYEIKMENGKLKSEAKEAALRLDDLGHQVRDGQAAMKRAILEKDTRIDAMKLEKGQLESELSQGEQRLMEQDRQYQQTIDELTRARSMDATALQTEHENAVKLNREKDFEIAELKRDMEQMAADHRDTNEMLAATMAGQKQLTEVLQEKDVFLETLKSNAAETQKELEESSRAAKEGQALKHVLEEKDKQLGAMKEENSHLKEEIDRLRDQQSRPQALAEPRTLDIITELETEIAQLKAARDALEEEALTLRRTSEEQRGGLLQSQLSVQAQQNELEQAQARHEQSTLNYEKLIGAKDDEIARLQEAVDQMTERTTHIESSSPLQALPPAVVILQDEKTQSLNGENGNEKHDLSKVEIEKLVKGIKEKESEISLLNEKNLSLAKQLDQLVVSRDEAGKLSQIVRQKDLEIQALHARVSAGGHTQDLLYLQQQLQAYAVEREQVLAVLNEKTRENSQLRSDYHRIMDIVADKESSILRLQQENQRLSLMGDPSGSHEMSRETIQNLSRIIREKDIEIDALTQKCQTLVTVLQTSGGDLGSGSGVSSNQFEELLQERDSLKQQVKKMDEWKQQVITTVKNMQHESAQLQEELLKLQGQVSADSDCNSQLSVDYTRLIQSYEQKERKLGNLSQELAHVQQTITQLSSTKDVLLGKLEGVAPGPEALTPAQATVLSVAVAPPSQQEAPSEQLLGEVRRLQQELEYLQRLLAERDGMIRTLQENNHRLSNSMAESEQRGLAEEARQAHEKLDSMQRSLREKDLLIKSKGDRLVQVSESLRNRENDNEVLKQAVTNLKERTLILEMDGRKLKEENELVMSRSREKESEFRALRETNLQVSLLLREKEFESNAMREKAAALEKMLKDGEQGKSGELNQLLNEVRSMQEKAVAFQQERDQVMLALKQKQMDSAALQNELQHMRDKEQRLKLELERLRNHLLEIEDSYTREALAAEDRETDLRKRVALLEDKLATSSSAVENASQQASLQVESLQEQLTGVVRQRDDALVKLRTSQEQVNQYAVSLSNLQMVLEQFQQEEKAMYSTELEKHKKEKDEWRRKAEMLEEQASALQINLDEATAALDSASRLSDQLDLKEEQIEELKKQMVAKDETLEETQNQMMNLVKGTEGKVDKVLMRNLFVGHFHAPKSQRPEVLRVMGTMVGLDREEVDKLLQEEGRRGLTGWVSGWLGDRAVQSVPNTPQRPGAIQGLNSSFSEMFVKFMEVESRPLGPAPKLPVYDIKPLSAPPAGRTPSSAPALPPAGAPGSGGRAGDSNPFLAPRSAAVPLLNPGAPGGGGGGAHMLLKPLCDTLPSFMPVPVSAAASGGAVLKGLLQQ
ncbi:hypothetical protein COCON_G00017620 [Conger conger]|uniref:GRIP domain-containing protein n=1 Tax=Conger conger TaxID=82655 RepID=A0A9Q1E3W4_CONCO|nr:hypothetical protein COCON_G00017620 [Conger conger]